MRTFCLPSLCPRYCWCVISEEANVFIAEVFGANDSFQHELRQKLFCHFQIVYILAPPRVCWYDQPGPQFSWLFQAPNCLLQCVFSWYPTASNTFSRCIYPAQKLGVSHDQLLFHIWFMWSFLQQHYTDSKFLLYSWEIFPPKYSRFHLQDFVNWSHQKLSYWDCCCCMLNFSNQFFD